MKTRFAENFSSILRIKDISQTQFAKLYGVKQNTVSQWANGKREPTFHDLMRICTLLDTDVKEMLGFTPRTRQAILRDIIGNNKEFQAEQDELQATMRAQGYNHTEIQKACEELYKDAYEQYKKIFNFDE